MSVNPWDTTITRKPTRRRYTFGPGALESIWLSAWTTEHGVGRLRVRGTYTVYCGAGNEHVVTIDDARYADTFDGCSAGGAAEAMISDWLDDEWSCDCES